MMRKIDLHIHSTNSDGCWSVKEIFENAQKMNIRNIAITDHNTINNKEILDELSNKYKINYVNGIEVTARRNNNIIHLLGYNFDDKCKEINKLIEKIKKEEDLYYKRYVNLLKQDSYNISINEYASFKSTILGGWKLLNFLIEKNICKDGFEYFDIIGKYKNICNYPSVEEVIEVIKYAEGTIILAHPGVSIKDDKNILDSLNYYKAIGIDGVECFHPLNNKNITKICNEWCIENNKLITGGSDYHGNLPDRIFGEPALEIKDLRLGIIKEKLYEKFTEYQKN